MSKNTAEWSDSSINLYTTKEHISTKDVVSTSEYWAVSIILMHQGDLEGVFSPAGTRDEDFDPDGYLAGLAPVIGGLQIQRHMELSIPLLLILQLYFWKQ